MKKLLILASTVVLSFSCLLFAKTASAKTEVSAVVVERGHHHRHPYWHRHHHRYPYWRRHHHRHYCR